ncbi:nitrile hydratase subunit alpha [Flavobacterium sp. MAH-1]|uniref:Nitrile hydratase subunit alpha n=1 Tax=Flavobacterium agri TaxID=2743471 RepID=A0A7Y8XZ87_9FLAO|nr:nitrile hydratase subunit alpha [Flavobacterium agri]NUY79634.1 nitrile hydratase subunit alpha [Flavobacterium agri]NYA69659.1 nitrile hydratase subunit alpha [Flavobacterium agri]
MSENAHNPHTGRDGDNHPEGHDHAEEHEPIIHEAAPSYYEILEISIRELLTEKGILRPEEIRRQIEVLDSRSPALGAKMVVKAWLDPAYRSRLVQNGNAAAEEMGISIYDNTKLTVLENTPGVHHVIVCTLCSCYPRPILGLPPDWYKSKEYRSRTVREPRAVLAEFGTLIPEEVQVIVQDSTASERYMVLPLRPAGTENFNAEELEALVTRDTMIGVALPSISN